MANPQKTFSVNKVIAQGESEFVWNDQESHDSAHTYSQQGTTSFAKSSIPVSTTSTDSS
jgi:hypothetical protein